MSKVRENLFTVKFNYFSSMKNLIFAIVALMVTATSCRVMSRLTSSTQIETGQSFVLGEGQHGSYQADVKNVAQAEVEVFKSEPNGNMVSLGTLRPGNQQRYTVPKDTEVAFKNKGNTLAVIKINLVGDTQLSMSYTDNTNINVKAAAEPTVQLPTIKIKVSSRANSSKDYTVRGPAEQPFSFGITLGGTKRFRENLPVGTRIEDGSGRVVYTFQAADDRKLVVLD
jgi:hypothetical protein